jgi:exopolysaccharide biosynthesis polyprenyl glycosylphosphotransferase
VSAGNTWVGTTVDGTLSVEAWQTEFERVHRDPVTESRRHSRAAFMRRALVVADLVGLTLAFLLQMLLAPTAGPGAISETGELVLFLVALPGWVLLAGVQGLYGSNLDRAEHSTVDELVSLLQMVTIGVWLYVIFAWVVGIDWSIGPLILFWVFAVVLVSSSRGVARLVAGRSDRNIERTLVLGAGDVGQLIARKVRLHPEYGLRVIGFLDSDPRVQRADLGGVPVLGKLENLEQVSRELEVDRVIVAFSREPDGATMQTLRGMRDRSVVIDVVPRLFDLIGPRSSMHTVEGLPLVNVPPLRLSQSSLLIKRAFDVLVSLGLIVLTAPLFAYIALRIRLDTHGPIFFRQVRLGMDMEPFTVLKFRSMYVDTDETAHREYVQSVRSSSTSVGDSGMYKLEREDAVTPFGRWLRRTSLDELPQLINVLLGQMSLVGPRPCIPYEIENFSAHHFERFLVPQGITGLWQVSARANSTFGEALDMDVAYVRGWSLGLDFKLALKTPFALMRQRTSTT